METPIFEIRSLAHSYDKKPVLDIDYLQVSDSSIVGLVGPNGSGKSTLLRLLGMIERPGKGEIYFNGHEAGPFSVDARFNITLLPQDPVLMKRSVFANISYGLKLRGDSDDIGARVSHALSMVGLASEEFSRRPWYALSGGEVQRVALAARLALKPKVLLLDEPTANVDAVSAQMIKEAALKARRDWGTTLIIASHDHQWLYDISDRILHLFRGKICGSGRENIVFGPWEKLKDGTWGKFLSDDQIIRVSEPPGESAAAIIDSLEFLENISDKTDTDACLQGIVLNLSLDRSSGQIFITLSVGVNTFTISMIDQQIRANNLYPGKPLTVCYSPCKIKWV
ncbi:ABC transporter related protein [uncultured Desulfobacterium sp.]|uniref:ABC transporter related protein n=1 Tax=uncultured Desulfobacterium sp. TaxID=201089 RepID=A0A445N0S2_9BACT|nr:ABC transporter related protein [uncultured Desulfobacterium sp.]